MSFRNDMRRRRVSGILPLFLYTLFAMYFTLFDCSLICLLSHISQKNSPLSSAVIESHWVISQSHGFLACTNSSFPDQYLFPKSYTSSLFFSLIFPSPISWSSLKYTMFRYLPYPHLKRMQPCFHYKIKEEWQTCWKKCIYMPTHLCVFINIC